MKDICTENIEATKNLEQLKDAFLKRGHRVKLVKEQFDHVENTERWTIIKRWIDNIIQQTASFIFYRSLLSFHDILKKNWHIPYIHNYLKDSSH